MQVQTCNGAWYFVTFVDSQKVVGIHDENQGPGVRHSYHSRECVHTMGADTLVRLRSTVESMGSSIRKQF